MLKEKAKKALLWSGAEVLLRQGLQFFIYIALARLLSPDDFGTVALLSIFFGIASAFVDGGFSAALIQRKDLTIKDESTVFWLNIGMAAVATILLIFLAPEISRYFGKPILEQLTVVMAFNIFISALGSIQSTLLSRSLNFSIQMKISALSTTLSGSLAIWLAWRGYGVWALALQVTLNSILTSILLWCFSGWRPRMEFNIKSAKNLFKFGGYMMASRLLDVTYNKLYTVIIGKNYGVAEIGYYDRAYNTRQIAIGTLSGVLERVAFPLFSILAEDKEKFRGAIKISLRGMMIVNTPMMLGLAVVAETLILVLFGEKWLSAAPIIQVLCIGGIFWPIHVVNLHALMGLGLSNKFFRLEIIKKIIGTLFLVLGSFYGVIGLAVGQVVFECLGIFINTYYSQNSFSYGLLKQIKDCTPIFIISVLMAIQVYFLGELWSHNSSIFLLLIQIFSGIITYNILCIIFKIINIKYIFEEYKKL